MAKLYEKAWNETVEGLNNYKKNIIINNYPYKDRHDKEIANEVIREAVHLAEKWDMELEGKMTTPAPQ
jgi:hypothetical protein